MFIYLDESGDLGFHFDKPGTSTSFVIAVLVCANRTTAKQINKAVKRTLRKKLNFSLKKPRLVSELKGNATNLKIKKYFYKQINAISNWSIYCITLNKYKSPPHEDISATNLYNMMTAQLLEKIDFNNSKQICLLVDRNKGPRGMKAFNLHLRKHLHLYLPLHTKLHIFHQNSRENTGIQAIDMFSYGVFRKQEHHDHIWYNLFKRRIVFEHEFEWEKMTVPDVLHPQDH